MPASGSVVDGRWRLGAVLGRGAVADVYAGEDVATGRRVAVKVLRSTDPVALRRFDREVDVLGTIDHPRIVRLVGSGGDGRGCRYLVLEHAAGGSLAQRLAAGPLPPDEVAQLAVDLSGALAHAHAHGLVHRDLKPANVLLDDAGHAQLADFGIAQLIDAETLTATGWGIGTPAYIAPEQLRSGDVGPAADVYSLGLVLLEAATGDRAFPGNGLPAALARLEETPPIPPELPADLAAVVRAMTALEPDARPSAASIAVAVGISGDATASIPVADMATRALPALETVPHLETVGVDRRWWRLAPVAAAVLLVLAGWSLARDAGPPASGPTTTATVVVAAESSTTVPATTAPPVVLTTVPTSAPPVVDADPPGPPEPRDRPDRPGNGRGNGPKPRG